MRGRRSWPVNVRKAFALRLYLALRLRFGKNAPFERLKKALKEQGALTVESTVRGWLPPIQLLDQDPRWGKFVRRRDWEALRTPDLPALREVAEILDVSVDYLLGYPVPLARTDRELVSDLASQLALHIATDYDRRASTRRRDGLAAVLGGKLLERQPFPYRSDWEEETQPVRFGPSGDIITNRGVLGLQHMQLDYKAFLQQLCDRVFREADEWEREHKELERAAVRKDVAELHQVAAEIAEAEKEMTGAAPTEGDILRRLLRAALEPLDVRLQTEVIMMRDHLTTSRKRRENMEAFTRRVVERTIPEILAAQEKPKTARHRSKRPPKTARISKNP